eukprot:CAMPEP_0181327946 /NCGR_PEP_ID=MMETSP1101-20121128/22408_1 /TAXON_ID=46948 /ORGANISM="Rhodomonas abbreviata, Strain Caron Lab Isolate" /LENGTH=77 /DNA_ID=CAMNT_0023436711 /DNA_START=327 /DNA_END=560 /DNA_ORIENTATION=+
MGKRRLFWGLSRARLQQLVQPLVVWLVDGSDLLAERQVDVLQLDFLPVLLLVGVRQRLVKPWETVDADELRDALHGV